ncbi:MAG: hypothetical protein JWN87_1839, partial [Frankiales bacterium]|nr:hypothetical protein [Frankiales bacterium]
VPGTPPQAITAPAAPAPAAPAPQPVVDLRPAPVVTSPDPTPIDWAEPFRAATTTTVDGLQTTRGGS